MGKKKKFFAVRNGRKTGIFDNWTDTQQSVSGYSNAQFKGFQTESEALDYLENDLNPTIQEDSVISFDSATNSQSIDLFAYVDGSKLGNHYGYGIGALILDENEKIIKRYSQLGDKPELIEYRQIAGELEAVLYVLKFAIENNLKKIKIFYDYIGIQNWAEKIWSRNSPVSLYYEREFDNLVAKGQLVIIFEKVKAHSGNKYNEQADQLAKQAFSENNHIVNVDGSHSLKGLYNREDLTAMIDIINNDDSDLIAEVEKNSSDRIIYRFKTTNSNAKGTYTDSTGLLFLQGKSTSDALLQAVSYSVSLLPSKEDVLEVMASFTDSNLDANLVESMQKDFLPHYCPGQEDKVFENMIYQTLVNYDDESEAYDYTYKITPLFRLTEHILVESFNKIGKLQDLYAHSNNARFGDVILPTTPEQKLQGASSHQLKSSYVREFGFDKAELVTKLYSFFNSVRHPYSHGDEDANEIRVVEDNQEVQKYIKKGLDLFDDYYKLFI